MAAANGDGVSGSSHFLLKAAAAGKKPAGKGTGRKTRNEGGTEGEEADSELIDDYCKRRLSSPSVRPSDGDSIWRTMELLIRPSVFLI